MGPQDPKDVTQAIARDLTSVVVGELSSMMAHANHWLKDSNYEALRLRLEAAHVAAEAALAERLRWRRPGGG